MYIPSTIVLRAQKKVYKMNPSFRRLLYILLWYIIYPNVLLLILAPAIYSDPENVVFLFVLLLSYLLGIIDTIIRPFSTSIEEDFSTNPIYSIILLIVFFFNPAFIALAFYESKNLIPTVLPFWNHIVVSISGVILLLLGGIILVIGRYQLKQFGTGVLTIEEDHELITSGIFKYIRHPIYLGGLLGIFGFYIAYQSLVVTLVVISCYFVVFRQRLLFEESLLLNEFGEKYNEYMKQTKKMIPFIY